MAWICLGLDGTLIEDMGDGAETPVDGAVEAVMQLMNEGHRLTVFTSRFAPMPDDRRQMLKEQIEQELVAWGFPPMEVWTGTTRPPADVFIDKDFITFDSDWGLALAQLSMMLEERGLAPAMQPEMGLQDPAPEEVEGEEPPAKQKEEA